MWGFLSGLWGKLLAFLAAAGAILAAVLFIRQGGKDAVRRENEEKINEAQDKKSVDRDDLRRADDDALWDELRDRRSDKKGG